MSPLNRGGGLMGPRLPPPPPLGIRHPHPHPPPPRYARIPMGPGMPPRMMPAPPPPPASIFRPRIPPPRPGNMRPPLPPLFGPRNRPPPLMVPMVPPRGMGPRGPPPPLRPRGPPSRGPMPHMRPRFPLKNTKNKMNSAKKNKLEEMEMKKPWMSDEIRSEIQRKNKLYAKAKKNKDAKIREEFKDVRNKVTRLIRDAKNEYFSKNPDQAEMYRNDIEYVDETDENFEDEDEDEIYYCEMCDREFFNQELLNSHVDEHKVCGIDGCIFSAHEKLVDKHIKMQHHSGLYDKLKNLSTPEDIKLWIEERKRKYPTKNNIDLKAAEEKEKIERGEMIKQNGKRKLDTSTRKVKKRRNKKRKREEKMEIEEKEELEIYRGVSAFRGTACLKDKESVEKTNVNLIEDETERIDDISDDEDECRQTLPPKTKFTFTPTLPTLSLVADYSSDSGPEEAPIEKPTSNDCDTAKLEVISIPEPQKEPKHQLKVENPTKINKKDKYKSFNSKKEVKNISKQPEKRSNIHNPKRRMLLKHLLSKQIAHERNYICQCIKFIFDNNFFD